MYDSNNVHILVYLIFGILGVIVGKIVAWAIMRMPENKKFFSKEFFEYNKKGLEKNYICIIIMILIYCGLLYKFGLKNTFFNNLDLIKFMVLSPMLVISFFIDLKYRILPNRLNLTIFECGIFIAFLYGINNINMAQDMLLGMVVGALVFGAITVLGGIIAGKEAMGMGDVKFMGAVGLYFGVSSIVQISILAFFIGSIFSIGVILIRNIILKNKDEYMPFGPFLVMSSMACIFLPNNEIFNIFMMLCNGIANLIV